MSSVLVEEATERAAALRSALASRVVISDGAMGTMIQASDATLDDFEGHEGCNEVLNGRTSSSTSTGPTWRPGPTA
jgi:methionine synthase I (cobalamin-dependent)